MSNVKRVRVETVGIIRVRTVTRRIVYIVSMELV
jgi:hypothetical protein